MKLSKLLIVAAFSMISVSLFAGTLDDVRKRKHVICGVDGGLAGFSSVDSSGDYVGIDVDVCRAIGAAVLGDASAVKFIPLTAKERFTALSSGEIDVLSRNTTWTLTRDGDLGLNFAGVNYYDGQGFLVSRSLGVKSAKELDGASVCIQAGTTTELNLQDYFSANGMSYDAITYDTSVQTREGFESGRCDVLTSDQSQLAAIRSQLKDPASAVVLPEVISKEPLGPVVRQGDDQWFNIVKWVLNALINAEELGVTSGNARDLQKNPSNPSVERLLGSQSNNMGKILGLRSNWAFQAILQVGNYGEIFEKNVGTNTPLGLPRGVNQLWSKGGILYAPPIR